MLEGVELIYQISRGRAKHEGAAPQESAGNRAELASMMLRTYIANSELDGISDAGSEGWDPLQSRREAPTLSQIVERTKLRVCHSQCLQIVTGIQREPSG